jgi:2,3-bisphosphoglycerate-independent phosphoglycerate mutase
MTSNQKGTRFIILVGDGMADYPIEALKGQTPLEAARTENMDRIASCRIGRALTIPEGMDPGSDIANLSLLGYDPGIYHSGRSPLEAASMEVHLSPTEVAFRMNLVCLDIASNDRVIMKSHSAGDLSSEEGRILVKALQQELEGPGVSLHTGVAYRHLLVWDNGPENEKTIPPHDVLDQDMADYLFHRDKDPITTLIRRSWSVLKDHPVNLERRKSGLPEANSIWLWGQGRAPSMPAFTDRFGLKGGVISAVDLIKGIGIYAGLTPLHVEGATGYLDTNYEGKVEAALTGLETLDFIFLHVEAPDEAGHSGNIDEKIQAIEYFDKRIVGPVLDGLKRFKDYRVMVVSDHLTPIIRKTHTPEPTPFAWATRKELENPPSTSRFSERSAEAEGLLFDPGHELISSFLTS